MPEFVCTTCGQSFKCQQNLKTHMNKKNKCDSPTYKALLESKALVLHGNVNDDDNIKCGYCDSLFTSVSNLNRHIKSSCPVLKKNQLETQNIHDRLAFLEKRNEMLEKENEMLKKELYELKNIKTLNTSAAEMIEMIEMIDHGDESEYFEKDILKGINHGANSMVTLLEQFHFNDAYPQFQNIYATNISKTIIIYKDDSYMRVEASSVIDDLFSKLSYCIQDNYEKFKDRLDPTRHAGMNRLLGLMKTEDGKKWLKEQIKNCLYENRQKAIDTRKKVLKK